MISKNYSLKLPLPLTMLIIGEETPGDAANLLI